MLTLSSLTWLLVIFGCMFTFFLHALAWMRHTLRIGMEHWMNSVLWWWETVERDRGTLCCFYIFDDLQHCFQHSRPSLQATCCSQTGFRTRLLTVPTFSQVVMVSLCCGIKSLMFGQMPREILANMVRLSNSQMVWLQLETAQWFKLFTTILNPHTTNRTTQQQQSHITNGISSCQKYVEHNKMACQPNIHLCMANVGLTEISQEWIAVKFLYRRSYQHLNAWLNGFTHTFVLWFPKDC